tara:strand:+ start:743 stop:949 length:207 start_codon:yes stop_codon:yes gene_type:complete
MKYYKHKDNNVYCSVQGKVARFSKWKWSGDTCSEDITVKTLSDNFHESFTETTKQEYDNDWGNKLEKA